MIFVPNLRSAGCSWAWLDTFPGVGGVAGGGGVGLGLRIRLSSDQLSWIWSELGKKRSRAVLCSEKLDKKKADSLSDADSCQAVKLKIS